MKLPVQLPPRTKEGFLVEVSDWSPAVGDALAHEEGLQLSDAHWEVLHLLRAYYDAYDSSPAMRALVKYCRIHLGEDKGKSIYLLKLFPGSSAKLASKIAGLPKPANCL